MDEFNIKQRLELIKEQEQRLDKINFIISICSDNIVATNTCIALIERKIITADEQYYLIESLKLLNQSNERILRLLK